MCCCVGRLKYALLCVGRLEYVLLCVGRLEYVLLCVWLLSGQGRYRMLDLRHLRLTGKPGLTIERLITSALGLYMYLCGKSQYLACVQWDQHYHVKHRC